MNPVTNEWARALITLHNSAVSLGEVHKKDHVQYGSGTTAKAHMTRFLHIDC